MLDTFTHLLKLLENAFVDEGDLDELDSGKTLGSEIFSLSLPSTPMFILTQL